MRCAETQAGARVGKGLQGTWQLRTVLQARLSLRLEELSCPTTWLLVPGWAASTLLPAPATPLPPPSWVATVTWPFLFMGSGCRCLFNLLLLWLTQREDYTLTTPQGVLHFVLSVEC